MGGNRSRCDASGIRRDRAQRFLHQPPDRASGRTGAIAAVDRGESAATRQNLSRMAESELDAAAETQRAFRARDRCCHLEFYRRFDTQGEAGFVVLSSGTIDIGMVGEELFIRGRDSGERTMGYWSITGFSHYITAVK